VGSIPITRSNYKFQVLFEVFFGDNWTPTKIS